MLKKSILRQHIAEALLRLTEDESEQDQKPAQDQVAEPTKGSAADDAHKLGLVSKGWGNWADKTGKVVAKTVDGNLVKIDGADEPKKPQIKPVDHDPYGNPATLGDKHGRTQTHKVSAITGNKADDTKAISKRDALSQTAKDAYSDGGFGTFKGSEIRDTHKLNDYVPEPHQLMSAKREADTLLKKYNDPKKALEAIARSKAKLEERTKLLGKHNSNMTDKKHTEMDQNTKYWQRLDMAEKFLKGEQVGKPGTVVPPKNKEGGPVEVSYRGKSALVDFVNDEEGWAHITYDDGKPDIVKLGQLMQEAIRVRPVKKKKPLIDESDASDLAHELGLQSIGWGRWIDPESGEMVAKTVQGKLTRVTPEDDTDPDVPPKVLKAMDKLFKKAGHWNYNPKGVKHIAPRWNKNMQMAGDDSPFDAHAEETVKKLLQMIGDPGRLVRWLLKKFREETPNGKQRIMQYLGVVKKLGLMPDGEQEETTPSVPTPTN